MEGFFVFKDGEKMPRFGLGTWHLGESKERWKDEKEALEEGIKRGVRLFDTAEMYGDGRSEELLGEALRGHRREDFFLVSKVLPWNAAGEDFFESLQGSLQRLGTSYLDLYLLHWRGEVPLKETIRCMEEAKAKGLIRRWGVSNFDASDMEELLSSPGGKGCAVDQCLYHLGSRGVEYDLLPLLEREGIGFMAYCPLAEGGKLKKSLLSHPAVLSLAEKHSATPFQILLAFTLRRPSAISIPKSGRKDHVAEDVDASELAIPEEDWAQIDAAFPPPRGKVPLDIQ